MYISTCIKAERVGGMTLNTPKKHEVNWEIVLLLVISLLNNDYSSHYLLPGVQAEGVCEP